MKQFFSKNGALPLKSIGLILAGSLIYSFAMNVLILPSGMYSGGILGIAQLMRALLAYLGFTVERFDIASIIYYVINLPLMILAYQIGKAFFCRTFFCTLMYTAFLAVIPIPASPVLPETVTACLVGGVLSGLGIGLTLLSGGCGGGEEIVSVYLTKNHSSASVAKSHCSSIFSYSADARFSSAGKRRCIPLFTLHFPALRSTVSIFRISPPT